MIEYILNQDRTSIQSFTKLLISKAFWTQLTLRVFDPPPGHLSIVRCNVFLSTDEPQPEFANVAPGLGKQIILPTCQYWLLSLRESCQFAMDSAALSCIAVLYNCLSQSYKPSPCPHSATMKASKI